MDPAPLPMCQFTGRPFQGGSQRSPTVRHGPEAPLPHQTRDGESAVARGSIPPEIFPYSFSAGPRSGTGRRKLAKTTCTAPRALFTTTTLPVEPVWPSRAQHPVLTPPGRYDETRAVTSTSTLRSVERHAKRWTRSRFIASLDAHLDRAPDAFIHPVDIHPFQSLDLPTSRQTWKNESGADGLPTLVEDRLATCTTLRRVLFKGVPVSSKQHPASGLYAVQSPASKKITVPPRGPGLVPPNRAAANTFTAAVMGGSALYCMRAQKSGKRPPGDYWVERSTESSPAKSLEHLPYLDSRVDHRRPMVRPMVQTPRPE